MNKLRIPLIIILSVISALGAIYLSSKYLFSDFAVGKRYLKYFYYDGAIKKFQDVLNKDPNNAEAHIYLGVAYGKKREYGESLKELEMAASKDAKLDLSSQIYNDIGMIYYLNEKYPQAINGFKNATAKDPNFIEAFFNLGAAYSASGKEQEALGSYRKVLNLDSQNVYAHWNIALILEKKGDIKEAIVHWKKYVKNMPGVFRNTDIEKHIKELQDKLASNKK